LTNLPSRLIRQFDHVGVAVWNVDEALETYKGILGGKVVGYKLPGTTRDYTFTQVELGGQRIEFITPQESGTTEESFLTKFLKKHGEGLHHLTFQVNDISESVRYLKENGIRIVDESYEDPVWKTAFLSPRSTKGVLIQLYETQPGSVYDHSGRTFDSTLELE
jgi:methylmalonyl-CoA/ethylmalonyl-CoA epimerase